MKFDYVIGNPPYQEDRLGDNKGYAPPVYHRFLEESYKVGNKVEMIHPARFLFNAGSTPKQWNEKMLNDPHLKVQDYEQDSSKVFSNTEIKGGIAITYHDEEQDYGKIGIFTPYESLNKILEKIRNSKDIKSFSEIMVSSYAYHFTDAMHIDYPKAADALSKGHAYDLKSNVFSRLPYIFHNEPPLDGNYVRILGRENNERAYKYIKKEYINNVVNLDKYKVFLSKANGIGALGEVLSPPIIGEPYVGATETFMSVGKFETLGEAQAALAYIMTKFARILLGVLKTTQDITPDKWRYVPLQNFSKESDINWTVPVPDIDKQLYKKYGLDEDEIDFIEKTAKEMD